MFFSKTKNKTEFSKWLLVQESALIWIMNLVFLALAFYCIYKGYLGSLPWLAAMVGFPWTAYGVSQVYYYKKSLAENTKDGVKYESVLAELNKKTDETFDFSASYAYNIDPSEVYTATNNVDNFQI